MNSKLRLVILARGCLVLSLAVGATSCCTAPSKTSTGSVSLSRQEVQEEVLRRDADRLFSAAMELRMIRDELSTVLTPEYLAIMESVMHTGDYLEQKQQALDALDLSLRQYEQALSAQRRAITSVTAFDPMK